MSHFQQNIQSLRNNLPFHLLEDKREWNWSAYELQKQLAKNPNLTVNIQDFNDTLFGQITSKFKAAAELLQKERIAQAQKAKGHLDLFKDFIATDVLFDNIEEQPLEQGIIDQLDNLERKSKYKADVDFFVLVAVDNHRLYLAEDIKSKHGKFHLISNQKEHYDFNTNIKHQNRIFCSKDYIKVVLKYLKANFPLVPVLLINDTHKSFFSTGKLFDKIEGQYIGQSKKVETLLDFAVKHPELAKKYMNRILLNSGMNSGKSFSMFKQFVSTFKKMYGEGLYTIVISPRLLLLEQTAKEEKDFVYYSSDKNAIPAYKFNPKEVKNILTTFQSATKIIERIKAHHTNPKIVLFVDEAHILYDSSFMNLHELISLIMDGSISKTIGLTATPYRQFEKDWNVLRLDRTIKPKRKIKVVRVFGHGQKEARFAAMNYLVTYIKKNKLKTTANFIKGRDEVKTLTQLMNIDLARELEETGGKAYALSGTSSKEEVENNKFRTSIIERQSPLFGSHFNATKIADVGINMKKLAGQVKNCLALSSYIAESDYNFADITTFLQSTSRDRDFKEKEILLIIPVNTKKKEGSTYDFDFDSQLKKSELLRNHLNTNYEFYKANSVTLDIEALEKTKKQYSQLTSTDKRMRFLSFNENTESWEIYMAKLYERQIEHEAKRMSKHEFLGIVGQFFEADIEFLQDEKQISSKEAEDISEALKLKKEQALVEIYKELNTKNDIHALASLLYHQSMRQDDRTRLFSNFVIVNENISLFDKDLYDAYVKFRTKLFNQILLIKDDLLASLYAYATIFKKANFENFQAVKHISFQLSTYKRKQTINRLEYLRYSSFRETNGLDATFSIFEGTKDKAKSGVSNTEYKYRKLIFDAVNDFTSKSRYSIVDAQKLLWHLQKVDAKLPRDLSRGGFESTAKMIFFLKSYFIIQTGLRIPDTDKKGIEFQGTFDTVLAILANILGKTVYDLIEFEENQDKIQREKLKENTPYLIKNKEMSLTTLAYTNKSKGVVRDRERTKEVSIINPNQNDIDFTKKTKQKKEKVNSNHNYNYNYDKPLAIHDRTYYQNHKQTLIEYCINSQDKENQALLAHLENDLSHQVHFEIKMCYDNNIKIALSIEQIKETKDFIAKNGYGKAPDYVSGNLTFEQFCRKSSWFVEETQYTRLKKQFEKLKHETDFEDFDEFVKFCEARDIRYKAIFNPNYFLLAGHKGYKAYCKNNRTTGIQELKPIINKGNNDKKAVLKEAIPNKKEKTTLLKVLKKPKKQGKIIDKTAALRRRQERMAERKEIAQNYNRNCKK